MGRMAPLADEAMARWWATRAHAAASPGAARALILMNSEMDVRHVLPAIRVPTLVMHRSGDLRCASRGGPLHRGAHPRRPVRRAPGRGSRPLDRRRRLPGRGRGVPDRRAPAPGARSRARDGPLHRHRRLDGEGARSSATGGGGELLGRHHAAVRRELERFAAASSTRPATASSPPSTGRRGPCAARCAVARAVRALGLEVRAGVHTGECELLDEASRRDRGAHRRARVGAGRPGRGRSSRARSRISSPAPASSSRTAASTS